MVIFLIILIIIAGYGAGICGPAYFNGDFSEKKNTAAVNGIFVVLVVFSHFVQYADMSGALDAPYMALRTHLSQMIVVPFLFYSGYGMMESIKRKGESYVKRIPARFLKLLLKFDIVVILFLIVDYLIGDHYPLKGILLAFTTWTAVGNSNWYITAILMLYACMFIAFLASMRLLKGRAQRLAGIAILAALTAAVMYLQVRAGRPGYCYNTMMAFPFGCLFSELREPVWNFITGRQLRWLYVTVIIVAVYAVCSAHRWDSIIVYSTWGLAFAALMILITMKVRVYNRALEWLGSHVFSIYMLQRIPMIILSHYGFTETHKYISLIAVFAVTLPLAMLFDKAVKKL